MIHRLESRGETGLGRLIWTRNQEDFKSFDFLGPTKGQEVQMIIKSNSYFGDYRSVERCTVGCARSSAAL